MDRTSVGDLIYALNPLNLIYRESDDELTVEVDACRREKALKLLDSHFSKNDKIGVKVIAEMASFVARLPPFDFESRPYAWTVDSTQNVYKFWVGFFGDTKLSKVIRALNSMVLSAGSAERNWSVRGGIHTKQRNRYDLI